jgi:heme/copper-type cytochrome/quinol oxidase subunit 2
MSNEGDLGGSMAINKINSCRGQGYACLVRGFTAGALAVFAGLANAAWELNLQMPVTALARRVYDLHTLLTWVIFIIFVGVFAVVTWSIILMRDTSNADITIKATGYQWKWGYDYLKGEGEGHQFRQHAGHAATADPQRNDQGQLITCSKSITNSLCRSARRFASSRLRTT